MKLKLGSETKRNWRIFKGWRKYDKKGANSFVLLESMWIAFCSTLILGFLPAFIFLINLIYLAQPLTGLYSNLVIYRTLTMTIALCIPQWLYFSSNNYKEYKDWYNGKRY